MVAAEKVSWNHETIGLETWRKSVKIINDDYYLPFYWLFILCRNLTYYILLVHAIEFQFKGSKFPTFKCKYIGMYKFYI